MLTITALKSTAKDGGAGGVTKYLTATEYFLDKDGKERSSSRWTGKAAAAFGLTGKNVDVVLMNKFAHGFGPKGEALRQNPGALPQTKPVLDREGNQRLDDRGKPMFANTGVRIGYDFTWSAPKSVSIAFAMADPVMRDKILAAHHQAVEKGIGFLETHAAETRRGNGSKDVIAAELLVSRHTHYSARPHEKDWKQRGEHALEIDPQLHTHALFYGCCRGVDGNWGTLEPKEMFRWKKTAGALYRAELASALRELGFGIEDDIRLDKKSGRVKDRFFKIAGIPDDLTEQMSGRRKQILEHMAEHGGSAQAANLATRRDKDEPSFGEMMSRWTGDLDIFRKENPGKLPQNVSELLGRKPQLS